MSYAPRIRTNQGGKFASGCNGTPLNCIVWRVSLEIPDRQLEQLRSALCAEEQRSGRDGLRALRHQRREDALKLKALRVQIKAGVDALKRGDFTEVNDADLDEYWLPLPMLSHLRAQGSVS